MNVKINVGMVVLLAGLANVEANLLVNGDFEQGNTGFLSSYDYRDHATAAGQYFVGDNSKAWNGNFPVPTYDHTSGSGLMLLVDGVRNLSVWQQVVSVVAGEEYRFSAWYADLGPSNSSRLDFLVDGISLGTVNGSYNTWQNFTSSWIASQSGASILTIIDRRSESLGNDFALDDLSVEVIPEPATASLFGISAFGAIWIRRRRRFKNIFLFFTPSAGGSFDAPRTNKKNAEPKKIRFSIPKAVASPINCTLNESRQLVRSKMNAAENAFFGSIESTLQSIGTTAKKIDRAFWNLFI